MASSEAITGNLCSQPAQIREAIEQDKQRWLLASQLTQKHDADGIKRWLAQQSGEYAEDMARRLRVCWRNKNK